MGHNMGFLSIFLLILYGITQLAEISGATENKNFKTKNTIVEFDPYVSILDSRPDFETGIIDWDRYGVEKLIPLVSLVATRFSTFYFELRPFDFSHNRNGSSLFNSILAVAKYNCRLSKEETINVYLLFYGDRFLSFNAQRELVSYATNVTDQIREVCKKTEITVLIKSYYVDIYPLLEYLPTEYKWGLAFEYDSYCRSTFVTHKLLKQVSVVVLEYKNEQEFINSDFRKCKHDYFYQNLTFKTVHKLRVRDTDNENRISLSRYVNFWKSRFEDLNNTYILAKAFDTWYDEYTIFDLSTDGWWRLVRDPANSNTSEFIFEEKQAVANKTENYKDPKNEWLRNEIDFNKTFTGIIYTGAVPNEILLRHFCQLLVIDQTAISAAKQIISNATNTNFLCSSELHLIIQHTDKHIYNDLLHAGKNQHVTVLLPVVKKFVANEYKYDHIGISESVVFLKSSGLKHGYIFDSKICVGPRKRNELFHKLIVDDQSTMFVFKFDGFFCGEKRRVFADATRRFGFYSVQFESCVKFVRKYAKQNAKIGLELTAYYEERNSVEFPKQKYIQFMKLINDWTGRQKDVVVFAGKDLETNLPNCIDIGWYFYDKRSLKFVTQREQALKLSNLQFSKKDDISNESILTIRETIIVVILTIAVAAILFTLGLFFVTRYYHKYVLTDEEIESFFNGTQQLEDSSQNLAFNVKYDKNKFEIPVGKFTLDNTVELGSGEFGKVFRGTLLNASGDVSVAVKTSNNNKWDKSVFLGLLLEIKMLAYVGQHDNISELLGANTAKIKDGRVLIFLELCHLGSLETFLRNLRTITKRPTLNEMEQGSEIEMKCVNIRAYKSDIQIDEGLSNDLYRWSLEICKGMAYLAKKQVVHGDIATRNVLLTLNRVAKICDFGLSCRIHDYINLDKAQQKWFPWKWMAPEALSESQFNEKTDVWSYGITLWEIYSLGCTPYPGLSWNDKFVELVERGLRPDKPEFEEKEMYKTMKNCWEILPHERPTFAQLLTSLVSGDESNKDYTEII